MKPWQYVLGLVLTFVAFYLSYRWMKFLERKGLEEHETAKRKETAVLDQIQDKVACILEHRTYWKVSKPVIKRKSYRLEINERNCDEANALVSPWVAVQFNAGTGEVELRLYVKNFFRSGDYHQSLEITNTYNYLLADQIAEQAIKMYELGFDTSLTT